MEGQCWRFNLSFFLFLTFAGHTSAGITIMTLLLQLVVLRLASTNGNDAATGTTPLYNYIAATGTATNGNAAATTTSNTHGYNQ